jgi:precorrin-2 methylase
VVPIVPYAFGPTEAHDLEHRRRSTIQDWWPEFVQFENDHARPVAVLQNGDPDLYERYLYTLRILAPAGGRPLARLCIEVLRDAGPVLAILAVTVER